VVDPVSLVDKSIIIVDKSNIFYKCFKSIILNGSIVMDPFYKVGILYILFIPDCTSF